MKLFLTCLSFTLFLSIDAQPGTLDKGYGINASATVLIKNRTSASASVLQPDNSLIVGGTDYSGTKFSLMRLNKEGAVDTEFGDAGESNTSFDDLVENLISIRGWQSIAIEPDGKIVATGSITKFNPEASGDFPQDNDIVVARYLPDGTTDNTFGNKGRLLIDLGLQETASAVAIQPDGKIVVAGYQARNTNGDGTGVLLVRLTPNGILDPEFGVNKGYTKYGKTVSKAYALLLMADGRIIAGGSGGAAEYFFLVGYKSDGFVDASFGNEGAVSTLFTAPTGVEIKSLSLDYNTHIVAAGKAGTQMGVARYLANGQPDNSFDTDGKNTFQFKGATNALANTVLVQAENKLVVTGAIAGGNYLYWTTGIVGVNSNGSVDTTFGKDGYTTGPATFQESTSPDAVLQTDGKILISGNFQSDDINNLGYSVTRYNGYPQKASLYVRIKRWLQNHTITWKGLPVNDGISYYSVEQSGNEKTGFTALTNVSNTSNLTDYSITNSRLLRGTNYYRIKAVSFDGAIRYSEVVSADNSTHIASIFPNPARNYITVTGLSANEVTDISIKDGGGTLISKGKNAAGSGQYNTSLRSNMQPGTYYLDITASGKTETIKFVKE